MNLFPSFIFWDIFLHTLSMSPIWTTYQKVLMARWLIQPPRLVSKEGRGEWSVSRNWRPQHTGSGQGPSSRLSTQAWEMLEHSLCRPQFPLCISRELLLLPVTPHKCDSAFAGPCRPLLHLPDRTGPLTELWVSVSLSGPTTQMKIKVCETPSCVCSISESCCEHPWELTLWSTFCHVSFMPSVVVDLQKRASPLLCPLCFSFLVSLGVQGHSVNTLRSSNNGDLSTFHRQAWKSQLASPFNWDASAQSMGPSVLIALAALWLSVSLCKAVAASCRMLQSGRRAAPGHLCGLINDLPAPPGDNFTTQPKLLCLLLPSVILKRFTDPPWSLLTLSALVSWSMRTWL